MRFIPFGLAINIVLFSATYAEDVGTFTGRILASDGTPVKGATIAMPNYNEDAAPLGEATTDAKGMFTISIEERGGRMMQRRLPNLLIEADGYAATYVSSRNLTLFPHARKHLGDIVLDVGRIYSGRVVDETGRPIAGAVLKCGALLHVMGHTAGNVGKEMSVTTDSGGCFQTPPIPLGTPYAYVQLDGYLLSTYDQKQLSRADSGGHLPDLVLKPDNPIHGIVKNELGEPMTNVDVRASMAPVKTDRHGHFTLRGFGDGAHFQLQISVDGYAFINWGVDVKPDGFEHYDVGKTPDTDNLDAEAFKKAMDRITVRAPTLEIVMQREAQILGRVVDAETGDPVTISRLVRCTFTRKKDGEIVMDGCRDSRFTQLKPGEFSLSYSYPTEYHLTISAKGYVDAEAFTPRVDSLRQIDGIVVKMTRKSPSVDTPSKLHQQIKGVVMDGAKPLEGARVALWRLPGKANSVNAYIIRGRTTVGDGHVFASAVLKGGHFSLDVPYQHNAWYLLVETAKRIVALHGPIAVAKGETKSVELKTRAAGGVRGLVSNGSTVDVPLYAVLFSDFGIQYVTRVRADGSFEFTDIYPGIYGLKAGSDAILDTEIPDVSDKNMSLEDRLEIDRKPSQPWKRATRIVVEEGRVLNGLVIDFVP